MTTTIQPNEESVDKDSRFLTFVINPNFGFSADEEPWSSLLPELGLRACWSTPILSTKGVVLGTIAMYSLQSREITDHERKIVEQFTHLASIVVERKRAEEALRKSEAFLAEGQRISHMGRWAWNIKTGKLTWSEEQKRIFGFPSDMEGLTFDDFAGTIHPEDRTAA